MTSAVLSVLCVTLKPITSVMSPMFTVDALVLIKHNDCRLLNDLAGDKYLFTADCTILCYCIHFCDIFAHEQYYRICRSIGKSRSFYIALARKRENYTEPREIPNCGFLANIKSTLAR